MKRAKTMKRILSLSLALVMVLAFLAVPPALASGATLSLGVSAATEGLFGWGEEVTIELELANFAPEGIRSISFLDVSFDAAVLEWNFDGEYISGHAVGEIAQHFHDAPTNWPFQASGMSLIPPQNTESVQHFRPDAARFSFTADTADGFTGTNTILSLNFRVRTGAPVGPSNINLSFGNRLGAGIILAENNALDTTVIPFTTIHVRETEWAGVGNQQGILVAGVPGSVGFPVSSTEIPAGSYPVTVDNLPAGVSVASPIEIDANGDGVLTLNGDTSTISGTHDGLILNINNVSTLPFALTISEQNIFVGAQSGVLEAGDPGTVTFPVITRYISPGTYPVSISGLPSGVTAPAEITLSADEAGGGFGSLVLTGDASAVAGTSNLAITLGGVTSEQFTLEVIAMPTEAIRSGVWPLPSGNTTVVGFRTAAGRNNSSWNTHANNAAASVNFTFGASPAYYAQHTGTGTGIWGTVSEVIRVTTGGGQISIAGRTKPQGNATSALSTWFAMGGGADNSRLIINNAGTQWGVMWGTDVPAGWRNPTGSTSPTNPTVNFPANLTAQFGQTLGNISLPSGFSWALGADTFVGGVGTNQFVLIFTPNNLTASNTVAQLVNVNVTRANPVVNWPEVTAERGQRLSEVPLPSNGAGTRGSFAWANPDDYVGEEGVNTHAVIFTPADTANYNTANGNATVMVTLPAFEIQWPENLTAAFGQTLGDVVLPTDDNGIFSWTTGNATPVGNAGTRQHSLTFTPHDTDAYSPQTRLVIVMVNQQIPVELVLPSASNIAGGLPLSTSVLTGGSANGTWAWANGALVPPVGTNNFDVVFSPNDLINIDWSALAGWDADARTITRGVSLTVLPAFTVEVVDSFSINSGEGSYYAGATVNINAGLHPDEHDFDGWTAVPNIVTFANPDSASTFFEMPAEDVVITANWVPTYSVTLISEGATGASGAGRFRAGAMVNVNAGARQGVPFGSWSSNPDVNFANQNEAVTNFEMPASDVTITANWSDSRMAVGFVYLFTAMGETGGMNNNDAQVEFDVTIHQDVTLTLENFRGPSGNILARYRDIYLLQPTAQFAPNRLPVTLHEIRVNGTPVHGAANHAAVPPGGYPNRWLNGETFGTVNPVTIPGGASGEHLGIFAAAGLELRTFHPNTQTFHIPNGATVEVVYRVGDGGEPPAGNITYTVEATARATALRTPVSGDGNSPLTNLLISHAPGTPAGGAVNRFRTPSLQGYRFRSFGVEINFPDAASGLRYRIEPVLLSENTLTGVPQYASLPDLSTANTLPIPTTDNTLRIDITDFDAAARRVNAVGIPLILRVFCPTGSAEPLSLEFTIPDYGDANGNGFANAGDAGLVGLLDAGFAAQELDLILDNADANGNGFANAGDAGLVGLLDAGFTAEDGVVLGQRNAPAVWSRVQFTP